MAIYLEVYSLILKYKHHIYVLFKLEITNAILTGSYTSDNFNQRFLVGFQYHSKTHYTVSCIVLTSLKADGYETTLGC